MIPFIPDMSKNFRRYASFFCAFLLGLALGVFATGRTERARGDEGAKFPETATVATLFRKKSFAAALRETITFEKASALAEVLATANPARFPKWWDLTKGDAVARGILLDAWLRKDAPGLARHLPKLSATEIIEALRFAKEASASGLLPSILREAARELPEAIVSTEPFLQLLAELDAGLAEALTSKASPKAKGAFEKDRRRAELERQIESDPIAILKDKGGKHDERERRTALVALGEKDFASALEIAESCPSPRERAAMLGALVSFMAAKDPNTALVWAMENLDGSLQASAIKSAIQAYGKHSAQQIELLNFAGGMPNRWLKQRLIGEVMERWLDALSDGEASDLDAFVDRIRSLPPEEVPLDDSSDLRIQWANTDLASSSAYLVEAPADLDLGTFTYWVAQRFNYPQYGPDPIGGVALAAQLTPERARIAMNTIAHESPPDQIAAAVAALPEGDLRSQGLPIVATRWASRDPAAATACAQSVGDAALMAVVRDRITELPKPPTAE